MEYHRNGAIWIHAVCVACDLTWKERYRLDFAYECAQEPRAHKLMGAA